MRFTVPTEANTARRAHPGYFGTVLHMTSARQQQLDRFIEGLEISPGAVELQQPLERFALAAFNDCDQWWITTHPSVEDAAEETNERLRANLFWLPEGVVDLDTGDRYRAEIIFTPIS